MSRRRRLAVAAVLALVVSLVVPISARATTAVLGPVLEALPASGYGGGPGTPALNAAVSSACQSGAPIASARWFTLPQGPLGTIWVQGTQILYWLGRDAVTAGSHTAVVDYDTGKVLSCDGVARTGMATHLGLVSWLTQAEYAGRSACANPMYGCAEPEVSVYAAPTTGVVPPNDHVAQATVVPALPFHASGDRTLADGDGPVLLPNEGWLSGQAGTVWFRYTATASGRVPVALTGDPYSPGAIGVGIVGASSVTPVDLSDGFRVVAGTTYLITVATPLTEYDRPDAPPGGAYDLWLGALGTMDAPSATAAAGASGAIHVGWVGGATAAAAAGITLELSVSGASGTTSGSWPWGVGEQAHDITGLVPGAEYTLTARLHNAAGLGVPSVLSAHAGVYAEPQGSAVSDLDARASSSARSVTVTWEAAGSYPSAVTGYRVSRDGTDSAGVGPWSTTVEPTARSFTFTRLVAGRAYRFTVTPLVATGVRPSSSVTSVVVAVPTVPGADLGVSYGTDASGNWDTGNWVVRWNEPSWDGQTPITGYRLTRSGLDTTGAGPFQVDLPATAREFTLTKLLGSVNYTISVRAVNAVGAGPAQTVVTEQFTPVAPAPATGVTAVAGDASAVVSWTAPSSWGSSAANSYRVEAYRGSTDELVSVGSAGATTTSLRVGSLVNGQSYSFRVVARNQDRETTSARSNVVTPVKPPAPVVTVPGVPRIGVASGSLVSGKVRAVARWLPPVSDGGSAVLAYRVYAYRLTASGAVLSTTVSPRLMASYRAWTMLLPVGRYRFAVRAANAVGYSTYSAWSNLVAPARVPTAPRIGVATSGVAGGPVTATARWYAPLSNGGAPITAYRVYAFRVTSTGVVLSYTYSPLLRATTRAYTMTLPRYGWYRFAVRAVNAMGYSPFSAKSLRIIGR